MHNALYTGRTMIGLPNPMASQKVSIMGGARKHIPKQKMLGSARSHVMKRLNRLHGKGFFDFIGKIAKGVGSFFSQGGASKLASTASDYIGKAGKIAETVRDVGGPDVTKYTHGAQKYAKIGHDVASQGRELAKKAGYKRGKKRHLLGLVGQKRKMKGKNLASILGIALPLVSSLLGKKRKMKK